MEIKTRSTIGNAKINHTEKDNLSDLKKLNQTINNLNSNLLNQQII